MYRLQTALPRFCMIAQVPLWIATIIVVACTGAEGAPWAAAAGTATIIGYFGSFVIPMRAVYVEGYRHGYEDGEADQQESMYPSGAAADVLSFRATTNRG